MRIVAAIVLTLGFVQGALAGNKPFPSGDASDSLAFFEIAVYYEKNAPASLKAIVETEARKYPGLDLAKGEPKESPKKTTALWRLETDVPANYSAPSVEMFHYFGHGISRDEVEALQHSQQALVVYFAAPAAARLEALRTANTMMESVARSTRGFLWDEEAREIFSPDAWKQKRIDTWKGEFPDVSKEIVIHAYRGNDAVRAVTLGMTKFGLPDIVVEDVAWSINDSIGNLVNLLAQRLVGGAAVGPEGRFALDLRAIRTPAVRDRALASILGKAPGTANLVLKQGTPDEGDPENRLIEIGFDAYPGKDVSSRQHDLLLSLFGASDDKVSAIRHNEALLAASAKARAKLPELHRMFTAGLAAGEYFEVKVPFDVPGGGHEYMWVEVSTWKDDGTITGLLRNEPVNIATLHGGQTVRVREADVFDYLVRHPDGSEEGNLTSAVIRKMEED